MRFLTKEWYRTMTDSGLGVLLTADERAANSSEKLFQTLRAEKLEAWLRDRQEVCEILEEPFDPEREARRFEEMAAEELRHYRERTPAATLQKVADLRVLALGYGTKEVCDDFEAYRAACEEKTERTMKEAWELQKAQGFDWTGGHSLHDSLVQSLNRAGEELVIEFRRDEVDWPEIRAIRFRDARILKQERSPENAWWLYDEIWKTDEGYEVHALLWRENDVFELTIGCREPELVWTMPLAEK